MITQTDIDEMKPEGYERSINASSDAKKAMTRSEVVKFLKYIQGVDKYYSDTRNKLMRNGRIR